MVDCLIGRWGELESGKTTIAFTPVHQRETDRITGAVQDPWSGRERPPVELCFAYMDVDAAYKVYKYSLALIGNCYLHSKRKNYIHELGIFLY